MKAGFKQQFLRASIVPVVRFCLRRSLQVQDLLEAAKTVFVEEAKRELKKGNAKITVSAISLMTGLQRRDVMRIAKIKGTSDYSRSLLSRVIGQWQYDKRFCFRGKPRTLEIANGKLSFRELVLSVSQDLNPGSVLKELRRQGSVLVRANKVQLQVTEFVPKGDLTASLNLLSADATDLNFAVEENLRQDYTVKHLHGKTEFDNIASEHIPQISRWLIKEGTAFHAKARAYLSKFDRDITKENSTNGPRFRVALGTFSFFEELRAS